MGIRYVTILIVKLLSSSLQNQKMKTGNSEESLRYYPNPPPTPNFSKQTNRQRPSFNSPLPKHQPSNPPSQPLFEIAKHRQKHQNRKRQNWKHPVVIEFWPEVAFWVKVKSLLHANISKIYPN